MYILDIVPLILIPRRQPQILSYFFDEPLVFGSLVEVPFNRRKIKGVVISSANIKNRKLDYKKLATFELKNIGKVIERQSRVSRLQFETADFLSTYYFAPLGLSLKTVLPPFWEVKKFQIPALITKGEIATVNQKFIMVPEKILGRYLMGKYEKFNPVFVTSDLSNAEYFKIWQSVERGTAKLIIGTRVGLFLPFNHLSEIIVEDESNEAYKSDMTPRYNAPDLAAYLAKLYKARIEHRAIVPRLETYNLNRGPGTVNSQSLNQNIKICSMIAEIRAGNFSIFSRELKEAILQSRLTDKNTILFVPRRGYSNFLLCQTCGLAITCPNCSASLIPHQSEIGHQQSVISLQCHHCGHSQEKPKFCPNCGSYQLKAYGIGLEKTIEELKKLFQYQNIKPPEILRLDSDHVKTEIEEEKTLNSFLENQGAIMLATQMIFSHKHLISVPIVGIINADTLINIPDFRAEESLFRQISILGQMTSRLIIQTHNPDDPAIKSAAAGEIKKFLDQELVARKVFNYPPFSKLIKLSFHHPDRVKAERETYLLAEKLNQALKSTLRDLNCEIIGPAPAFVAKERGHYIWNIVVKNQSAEIKKRNELLRLVPEGWVVDVDPKTII